MTENVQPAGSDASDPSRWKYLVTYKGWLMAALGFVCLFVAFAAPAATMPMIYNEVIKEFGWSHTQATLIFTYKSIVSAVIAMFCIGWVIDKWGLRTATVLSMVAVAVGMGSFLGTRGLVTYYLSGTVIGIGTTALLICVKVLVSRWFVRNQGLGVGVAIAGSSFGGAVYPLVMSRLLDSFGWRMALALISLSIWLIALPLYLWLAKENPTAEDILPDAAKVHRTAEMAEKVAAADLDMGFSGVLRMPAFWLCGLGIMLATLVDQGMFQHVMLYVQNVVGLSRKAAALSLSATFAIGVFAKIIAGSFYDKTSIRGVQAWYGFVAVTFLLALPIQGTLTLGIWIIARGFAHGGLSPDTAIVSKHVFGPRLMNWVVPALTAFHALGAALGPLGLSLIYDRTGSYAAGFILYSGLAGLAAVGLFWVRPFYRDRVLAITR